MFNKKKKAAAAEAEQGRVDQIAALQAQLDEVRSERAALETHVAALGETNDQLDQRLVAHPQIGVLGVDRSAGEVGGLEHPATRTVGVVRDGDRLHAVLAILVHPPPEIFGVERVETAEG